MLSEEERREREMAQLKLELSIRLRWLTRLSLVARNKELFSIKKEIKNYIKIIKGECRLV